MGYPNPSSRYHPTSTWDTDVVATGAASAFIPLPSHQCDEVTIIVLAAGVGLDICQSNNPDPTKFVSIDAPSGITIPVAGDSVEIAVRRTDLSATPVNVRFIWRKAGR